MRNEKNQRFLRHFLNLENSFLLFLQKEEMPVYVEK